jgi:hypothetical protein
MRVELVEDAIRRLTKATGDYVTAAYHSHKNGCRRWEIWVTLDEKHYDFDSPMKLVDYVNKRLEKQALVPKESD